MSSLHQINPKADVISSKYALTANITAAKSLSSILKTNLGPSGTLKMLVGGAGQLTLTKDGNVLLREMQIQHPTAMLIARTATAQDDVTGDGTTSVVLLAGELLRQAEIFTAEGLHPRVLVDGLTLAREHLLTLLEDSEPIIEVGDEKSGEIPRDVLLSIARTSLRTKLSTEMADHLTDIVVDAVLCVRNPDREDKSQEIDLKMVEIMIMTHKSDTDTRLVKGIVLDHGTRHPMMKKRAENCYILSCNIGMEWEKTEIHSGFYWSSAEQREKLVEAERKHVNDKVKAVIALKNEVCGSDDTRNFVVVNQNGIDPIALDMLQKNNIMGIRRAKRRNGERIPLACGGYTVSSEKDLKPECLGHAGLVYEHKLGDDKYTFIEDVINPYSCTILIQGPSKHTVDQVKDAVKDGLRAVKNAFVDKKLVAGAGCFEAFAYCKLQELKRKTEGRKKLGIEAFAKALLGIPRTLAENAGLDQQETVLQLVDAHRDGKMLGLDLQTGGLISPKDSGIYDNLVVKRQIIQLSSVIAEKLLLVDEIMRAGRSMGKKE